MKRKGILNSEISKVLSELGHTDTLTISDAGLPVYHSVKRIDLAIKKNLPTLIQVLREVLKDMTVEVVILAEEIKDHNQDVLKLIEELCPQTPIEYRSHDVFKRLTKKTKAVIRTGEMTPFANIILVSGVDFSGGEDDET